VTKPTQQLLPFPDGPGTGPGHEPPPPPAGYRPTPEARDAVARLEAWLTDPFSRRLTPAGEEALGAVKKALLEGKNSYWHRAESLLQALALRNEGTRGDDVPPGPPPEGPDFLRTVEDLLDCLDERFAGRGPAR
jgi:hypothetical protein